MSKQQIKSFLNKVNQDKRLSQKHKIYRYIKHNPNSTIESIFNDSTGMLKETIVGRVSELCDLGVVKYDGSHKNKSKLTIVENEEEQLRLFLERKSDKKNKYIKSLLNNFRGVLSDKTIYQLELEKSLAS